MPLGALAFVAGIVFLFIYFPFFWVRSGQTPGMRLMGIKVVRDKDGGPIGWGSAFLRLIGYWISAIVFYLGFIWIFIDKRKRGWYDLMAGTCRHQGRWGPDLRVDGPTGGAPVSCRTERWPSG